MNQEASESSESDQDMSDRDKMEENGKPKTKKTLYRI